MTDILLTSAPSPAQLREELAQMVIHELLGPAHGEHEELDERTVRDRYILGRLAPRNHTVSPEEQDDLEIGGDDGEDGQAEGSAPATATMMPSAMGLTFAVTDTDRLKITARWGRYERAESSHKETKSGQPAKIWQRVPMSGSFELPLTAGPIAPHPLADEYPDVYVQGLIRRHEGAYTISLFLVNNQPEGSPKDAAWVFQPELIVEAPDGAAIFCRRPFDPGQMEWEQEDLALQMAYRHRVEFAVGHGVGIHAEVAADNPHRARRLRTTVIPAYDVPQVTPPRPTELPELAGLVVDMKTLAESSAAKLPGLLSPLAQAYAAWITRQNTRLAHGADDLAEYQTPGQLVLDNSRKTLERIRAGIELLATNPQAAEAFRFANRAMWWQRIHSQYSERARRGEALKLSDLDEPKNRSWYPFQLAFILLNLPALSDLRHPERNDPTQAIADLLWFPTGGGKTEAYLGVAAYTMALRRLQGVVDGRSGMAGVAVLMRYTLRLLTLQQFQRATTLICACEKIRREAIAAGDLRWGEEPFRIGLWVGHRTTPNYTEHSHESLKKDHGQTNKSTAAAGHGSPVQLTNCPWCGAPIEPGKSTHMAVETVKEGRGRTFIYCGDPLGRCPFSKKQSPDEGIPALVVDEEIYRRLPTLLIATVDKFAQMPWKGAVQMLFGQVNGYCPRHGFTSPDLDPGGHASHPHHKNLPPSKWQPHLPLRPPDLIIQDELHLISGPLGTLMGLYETAVDNLASWAAGGQTVRPKVIASTATIRRAQEQVHALFLRQVNIFPPPGLDVEDNFFARQRPPTDDFPGRRYLGICAPGLRLKTTMIRVYVAVMAAAQVLFEKYGQAADPYMTLVGYFNAMRDLGGMRRVVDDAVRTRLGQMVQRGLANRYLQHWGVEELTSRKSATDIPQTLDRLEAPFDPHTAAERKRLAKAGQKSDFSRVPIDVLLATNMISVGVDVKRLGLMVVSSQPKTTAEYIQATSRVGRSTPGLVLTVFNWARPRDLSHYERFEHYHATFYQQVEALSVTPFSARAIDRGLAALLVAQVRLAGADYNENSAAGQVVRDHPAVASALAAISHRAELVSGQVTLGHTVRQVLEQKLDVWLHDAAEKHKSGAQLGYQGKKDGLTLPLLEQPGLGRWEKFTCLNSLRNVEPGVNLIFNDYGMDREPEVTE